ncbi:LysR substrate-binding domain-containing protein [Ruegeria atlantica]|uniref:LysR substrate-binding domain-containing protein n=1 Tax=Ruegeria atlantica TaxID=81569 RepID=UPI00147AFB63|nr:LysR substrate-binding domain-containing protein [Ruegeria atlantica]
MKAQYPPLSSIRAFEAVARCGTIRRAAAELGVSPSAVSHQIRAIESWFGQQMFDRRGRDLIVNKTGSFYFENVRPVFDQLRLASAKLTDKPKEKLKLLVCPSFASLWLVPRLQGFTSMYSGLSIQIHCMKETIDLNGTEFDCALRYCQGVPDGHRGICLTGEEVFPVCSEAYLSAHQPLTSFEDLMNQVLLHDTLGDSGVNACSWSSWFSEVGFPGMVPSDRHEFSDSNIMYEAACNGLGVALGRSVLVDDYLNSGKLIRPIAFSIRSTLAWYAVRPQSGTRNEALDLFLNWLSAEAARPPVIPSIRDSS